MSTERDTMQEWGKKNWSVIVMGLGVPLLMFANNAWMDGKIQAHLKTYVPFTVWQQWAEERAAWRVTVELKINDMEKTQSIDRRDIDSKLHIVELKLDRAVTILEGMTLKKATP